MKEVISLLMAAVLLALSACSGGSGDGGASTGNQSNPSNCLDVPRNDSSNYLVSGTVIGIPNTASVTLLNNGCNATTISGASNFVFNTALAIGTPYAVTISKQPTGYSCTLFNSSGNPTGNVTSVLVSCTAVGAIQTYPVQVQVSGLDAGKQFVLSNNGNDTLIVGANQSYVFATPFGVGSTYSVSVTLQPAGQTCALSNASGVISSTLKIVGVACAAGSPYLTHLTPVWKSVLGTTGSNVGQGVAVSPDGSVYLTGWMSAALDGNATGGDVFLSKYAADGTLIWTKTQGTAGTDYARAITLGLDGSVYIAGFFYGSHNGSDGSAFLSRYDPSGNVIWSKTISASGHEGGTSLVASADGSIFLAGITGGNLDGQTNNGALDGFVSKYKTDGTLAWTRLVGTTDNDNVHAIASDATGAVYATGWASGGFSGQNNFGGGDAFLVKYSPTGEQLWIRTLGSAGQDFGNAITVGKDGFVYIGGKASGVMDGQTYNGGSADTFLSKFSPDGTKLWTRLLGGSGTEVANAMVASPDGSILLCGNTDGNLDGQLNNGSTNIFFTSYGTDGTKVWTKLVGTARIDGAFALAIGSDGALFTAGNTTSPSGGEFASVIKYSPP